MPENVIIRESCQHENVFGTQLTRRKLWRIKFWLILTFEVEV